MKRPNEKKGRIPKGVTGPKPKGRKREGRAGGQ